MQIDFLVPGTPKQRGSKTPMRNRATGRLFVIDSCKVSGEWMAAVAWHARAAMAGHEPAAGPVSVQLEFEFGRPKAHFKPNGGVRDSAPDYVTKAPDADKLSRAILDALTGLVYRDDAQVADLRATKTYGIPGVHIVVSEL